MDVEKALSARVVMIAGNEDALRRKALSALLKAGGTGPEDFDYETLTADQRTVSEWVGSVSTVPFLGPKRVLVIRQLLRRGDPASNGLPGKRPFGELPESTWLVLVADDEAGNEEQQRKFEATRKAWAKAVQSQGGVVIDCSIDSRQVGAQLRDEAKASGKKLGNSAAERLTEMTGGNLSRALGELEKLILYAGDRDEIVLDDVRIVVTPSREWNVYKMVDSALERRPTDALRHLRILVGSSVKAEEAAFRSILPTLSRQLRLMWQARLVLDSRSSLDDVPQLVRDQLSEKPNLLAEPPWAQQRCMRAASRLSLLQIAGCLRSVTEADCRLKGLLTGFSGMDTLERLLLEIVEIAKAA